MTLLALQTLKQRRPTGTVFKLRLCHITFLLFNCHLLHIMSGRFKLLVTCFFCLRLFGLSWSSPFSACSNTKNFPLPPSHDLGTILITDCSAELVCIVDHSSIHLWGDGLYGGRRGSLTSSQACSLSDCEQCNHFSCREFKQRSSITPSKSSRLSYWSLNTGCPLSNKVFVDE